MPTAIPIPTRTRLRGRVVILALLGVVPLTLFVQWSDIQVGGTMAAGPFPPLAACLQWSLLLAVNALSARRSHQQALLSRGELLVLLAIWLAANMVVGRGLLHPLLTSLAAPTYYARGGVMTNAVASHIPSWLAVTDPLAARRFYEGYAVPVPWAVWWRPLLTWMGFFVPFLLANVCLCALFEKVWVRQERLAFPLVALPIEGFGQSDNPSHNRSFRAAVGFGLAVPLLLHGFGVAHTYIPAIPCVPFFNDVSLLVTDAPWTALRPLYVNFYPLLVGLTFLAPADITFSVWFFLLLNKAELVATAAWGWNDGASGNMVATPPYLEEQSAGAFLALAALLVWNARKSLKSESAQEAVLSDKRTTRLLLFGFWGGLLGVLAWCVATGLPLWFSAAYFGFYLAVALVLSRLMAEGGVSWILAPILPDKLILSLTGSQAVSPLVLTRLMLHTQHLRDTRQMFAPAVFQAGKLRDESGVGVRAFYGLLFASVCLALVVGVATALPRFYHQGALTATPINDGLMMTAVVMPTTAVGQATARLTAPIRPSLGAGSAVLAGAGITWLLSVLRLRSFGWQLHPLGYALTGTLQLGYANKMLFSIFLGWLFKTLTLRFGGAQGFRLLRGVALGLIWGDLLMGGLLKLLDVLLGPSGYAIF
jgi:hypothetical protein